MLRLSLCQTCVEKHELQKQNGIPLCEPCNAHTPMHLQCGRCVLNIWWFDFFMTIEEACIRWLTSASFASFAEVFASRIIMDDSQDMWCIFSLKTIEAAGIFGLSWASFSLHENFVSIWFVGKPQDIKLRPLNEFLERNFNCLNSMPMYKWLLPTLDGELEYQQRMHLLGNIVVPACGALASDILLRMHRQQWRLLLEGLLDFLMIVPSTVSSMVGFKTSFKQCSLLCCFCRLPSLQAESRTPSVKRSRRSNSEFQ